MTGVPTATSVTVLETFHKLDGEFNAMATAVENGEFALWVGSGISRKAPSLGGVIIRAIEYLRARAIEPATRAAFEPAFLAALKMSEVAVSAAEPHFSDAFTAWPEAVRTTIVNVLWKKYSKVLDIRIKHEPEDFLLWDAVDIRDAFRDPAPPACEHLCIAIMILEGAVNEVASANWDGFIEAAVVRLGGGIAGNLQVVVDPTHLRDAPAKARLLKFHGCIVHATEDPASYRGFLTASETQIIAWPDNPRFAAMKTEIVSTATNRKALMIGLSLQDVNLQTVFSKARNANPWPWPCAPKAQGHVFCEDAIGDSQRTMLKMVYAGKYNEYVDDIEGSALLRSWPEQVLLALVLKMLVDKLSALLSLRIAGTTYAGEVSAVQTDLRRLRDTIALQVGPDRTDFANRAIAIWSRMISLFRGGQPPTKADAYERISGTPVGQLASDMNVQAAGFGDLGVALAMLEHGRHRGLWSLSPTVSTGVTAGAMASLGAWPGAMCRPIFLARSASIALELEKRGAFADDNAIVIHADDSWHQMRAEGPDSARTRSRAPGRTGRVGTRHVSISALLGAETNVAQLRTRFIGEVTL